MCKKGENERGRYNRISRDSSLPCPPGELQASFLTMVTSTCHPGKPSLVNLRNFASLSGIRSSTVQGRVAHLDDDRSIGLCFPSDILPLVLGLWSITHKLRTPTHRKTVTWLNRIDPFLLEADRLLWAIHSEALAVCQIGGSLDCGPSQD